MIEQFIVQVPTYPREIRRESFRGDGGKLEYETAADRINAALREKNRGYQDILWHLAAVYPIQVQKIGGIDTELLVVLERGSR